MKMKESQIFPSCLSNILSNSYQSNISVYDHNNQIYAKTLHLKGDRSINLRKYTI